MDLQRFCSDDESKKNLLEPFSQGDFTFYTDGRIMARVARRQEVPERYNSPQIVGAPIGDLFDQEPEAWFPVPPVEVKKTMCGDCAGTGVSYDCLECEGSGSVTPHTEWNEYDEQECKTCRGKGKISQKKWEHMAKQSRTEPSSKCEECGGKGFVASGVPVKVGKASFSDFLLALIVDLPNAEIGPLGPESAARFRFDGGDGLVMPVKTTKA